MNEVAQDMWFFTKEGERCGPVTLAELRVKAAEAFLHPRLDMVWTQGMSEWKTAGEIDGLFEKRSAPEEEKEQLAPPTDPYTPPQSESIEETMSLESDWPGARRRAYLFAIFVFPFLMNVAIAMSAALAEAQFGPEIMGWIMLAAGIAPLFVAIYFSIQRLANLGMCRWWILGNLVPILNLWIGYRSFACPAGYAYHKKLDGIGIFLAIIYWLTMLLIIAMIAAVIAMMAGAIDNPELRQQIQNAVQAARQRAKIP